MTLGGDLIATREAVAGKRARLALLYDQANTTTDPARRDELASGIKSANTELATLVDRLEKLSDEYAAQQAERDALKAARQPVNRQVDPAEDNPSYGNPDAIVALKSSQKLADHVGGLDPRENVGLAKWLKAIITGDWTDVPAPVKAMSVGSVGAGGVLVPGPLSVRLIDLARNQARVMQAGAITVPMESSTLKIARLTGDPSGEWKAENAALSQESELSFDSVELQAHTLMTIATMSVELAEDGRDVDNVIERSLAAALALELDRAALYGSGSGEEPLGIISTPGVDVTDTSAGLPGGYADFSYAVERIRGGNYEPNAVIYSPGVAGILDRLVDSTGQPLQPLPSFAELRKLTTNQAAAGDAFVGDWSQLLVGLRTNLTIEASREAATETGNAFSKLQVKVRAYLRADVAVADVAAFNVLTDIAQAGS